MSHVRSQIRAAAVAALAPLGAVFPTRTIPVEAAELPVTLVYTNAEEIARLAEGIYVRELELVVELIAQGRDVDDRLDVLIETVEQLLNANRFGGLCRPLIPVSLAVSVDTSGDSPVGRARLTYRAVYQTAHAQPATSI